ncbi:MAG: hypothetical protein EXS38_02940 [Opitutus sp.]|nr:hypothetical protein [Opitutus sp.]
MKPRTFRFAPALASLLLGALCATTSSTRAALPGAADEAQAYERAYQQDVARRRAEDAKAQTAFEAELESLDTVAQFNKLLEVAERQLNHAEFQAGIRTFNRAMKSKPEKVYLTEAMQKLQEKLMAQSGSVAAVLKSDRLTYVTIANVRKPLKFDANTVSLPPGNYQVIGQRPGFLDVVLPLEVRKGQPPPELTVVCKAPVGK